jgi:hypothetical protein
VREITPIYKVASTTERSHDRYAPNGTDHVETNKNAAQNGVAGNALAMCLPKVTVTFRRCVASVIHIT